MTSDTGSEESRAALLSGEESLFLAGKQQFLSVLSNRTCWKSFYASWMFIVVVVSAFYSAVSANV